MCGLHNWALSDTFCKFSIDFQIGFHPATVSAFFNPPGFMDFLNLCLKNLIGNIANKSVLLAGVKWADAWGNKVQ